MPDTEGIAHTALLVMDVQAGIVDWFANSGDLLKHIGMAINAARSAHVPVIYAVVTFRKNYPEISSNNRSFSALKQRPSPSQETTATTLIHPAIAPQDSDIVITKRRVSAFTGSDLEVILRAQGITHLVLSGIATSGVVLSTLREAADRDYALTVLSDCCADGDEEVQRVLTTKVFPRQADVITAEEWITRLTQ